MALPSNNGIFIHEGLNCSPVVVPTAQSIPLSLSDSTSVKTAVDTTLSNIADEYDPTSTYNVGDCVLYQKVLYQCTTAIPAAESWDSAHWTAVKAVDVGSGGGGSSSADQVSYDNTTSGLSATNVQNAIDEVVEEKADRVPEPAEYDSTVTYYWGDVCTYNGNIYYNNSGTATGTWDSSKWKLCDAPQDYLHSINPFGNGSFSMNRKPGTTVGGFSFAAGHDVTASGSCSHAEGDNTVALGNYSHTEGSETTTSNGMAHAEGYGTTASGSSAHAEGTSTTASGNYGAHAEGCYTVASGNYSHAEGYHTEANHKSQHVFGEYNVLDPSTARANNKGTYIEIVGNGTNNSHKSNARTLDWSGNETIAGDLIFNGSTSLTDKTTLVKSASGSLIHITDGGDNIPVKSLVSQIVAVESGSGEKSPTNPYTISGFDSGVITRCGKNLLPSYNLSGSSTLTINSNNGVYSISGTTSSYRNEIASDSFFLKAGTYTFKNLGNSSNYMSAQLRSVDGLTTYASSSMASNTFTLTETTEVRFRFTFQANRTYNETCKPELEIGNEANTFNQYNGTTYNIPFGQTVYGGHFDNKGNLVVTHGYIASYNGEPINEPWISSMDNYVPNTSPSTGAQVVYPLTSPITLAITSQDIPTISGENNIFSNCGDLDIEYFTSSADEVAELIRKQPTPLHHYSLGEVEIGTWIDGSTLYEKTIQITSLSVGTATIQHGISHFDTLVSVSGRFTRADGKQSPISNVSTDTNSMVYVFNFTDTSFVLFIGDNYQGATALTSMYLTLQYTKTT